MKNEMHLFESYFGFLQKDNEGTLIYGYETISETHKKNAPNIEIPTIGGCFIIIQSGSIVSEFGNQRIELSAISWQATKNGAKFILGENARVLVIQREGYDGLETVGKPEIDRGRLKYIDGCYDTILFQPIRKGFPCLNSLFIPTGVHQTMHTHPSTRVGMILTGFAYAENEEMQYALKPGVIFYLPKDSLHKFRTDLRVDTLVLIAYHPDSDFGPTDEEHPMLNRTIVDGESAKILDNIRTK